MSVDKKRLAVSVELGMSYRNFVLTGILSDVARQGYEITILSTSHILCETIGNKFPTRHLPGPGRILSRLLRWEDQVLYIAFYLRHQSATMQKYIQRDRAAQPLSWLLKFAAAKFVDVLPRLRWLLHSFAARRLKRTVNDFDSILCLSFDNLNDKLLLLASEKTKTPCVVAVHSWDNLPARGFIAGTPRHLLVWNAEMVTQALRLHEIPSERVSLIGVPQFQHMLELKETGRDQLPDPRLIDGRFLVYCASATRVFPDEEDFVEKAILLAEKLRLIFVLRLHPSERVEIYQQRYGADPRVVLSAASSFFSAGAPKKPLHSDPALEFQTFTALMSRALAVINLASTTSLDAMLFTTPVICPTFNVDPKMSDQWNAAARWYESVHFSPVVESGAVELAGSFAEMEKVIVDLSRGLNPRRSAARAFMENFSPPARPAEILTALLKSET